VCGTVSSLQFLSCVLASYPYGRQIISSVCELWKQSGEDVLESTHPAQSILH
jgi:hypothetical protein